MFDLKMLQRFVDRYFEFYCDNPVSEKKLRTEFFCFLAVSYILGLVSYDDVLELKDYLDDCFIERKNKQ